MQDLNHQPAHSPGWIFISWASLIIAVSSTITGIIFMPVDIWVRAFMGMGLLFSVVSAFIVAKTTRDVFEAKKSTNFPQDIKHGN
ncbi:MAG: YiaA/YiaB family inner membrane protein [Microcoleaceae cyanobacterium]